jgi:hypothetical protein
MRDLPAQGLGNRLTRGRLIMGVGWDVVVHNVHPLAARGACCDWLASRIVHAHARTYLQGATGTVQSETYTGMKTGSCAGMITDSIE